MTNFFLNKKNIFLVLGIILILSNYFLKIFSNFNQFNDFLYLSNGILTDDGYLIMLLGNKSTVFQKGLTFFSLPYIIDRQFINIFGIEYFWILTIVYKLISFIILFIGLNKFFNFNNQNLLITTICLALFFCVDIAPFGDRYPRPQFTNIFVFVVILLNLYLLEQNRVSKSLYFFYGISQAIVAFTIPWMTAIISALSIYTFIYKIEFSLKKYSVIGFSIIFFPSFFFYIINTMNSSHSEYLGLKEIYSRTYFIYDFYLSIFFSKQFLLLFFIQAVACLIIKRLIGIKILFGSLLFSPFIFLLLGKSIQIYHLVEIFKEFQVILLVWTFANLIHYFQEKKFVLSNLDRYIGISVIIFNLIIIFNLGNAWIERSKISENNWNKNKKIYFYLNTKSSKCTLITDHKDIFFYWLNFKNGLTLPKFGFINTAPVDKTIEDIKLYLAFMSDAKKSKITNFNLIIKLATHNYYVSTRSTIAKSIKFKNDTEREKYLKTRIGIKSMESWSLAPDEEVYKKIEKYNEISISEEMKKNKIIIYKDPINSNLFQINDYCVD